MKKITAICGIMFFISIILTGRDGMCNKELELKEKCLLLLMTSQTQNQTSIPTQPKTKEEAWPIFWTTFSNAVKERNQKALQKLSQPDDKEFNANEVVGAAAIEYTYRDLEDWDWENMQNAIKTGIKQINSNKNSTQDEYCVFVYRNNNWYFYGIIAE